MEKEVLGKAPQSPAVPSTPPPPARGPGNSLQAACCYSNETAQKKGRSPPCIHPVVLNLRHRYLYLQGFPGSSVIKHLPATQEMKVLSLCQQDLLEKEITIHSSILAWETPWTAETGRLQSMGSQRVGHDLVTK